MPKRPNRHLRGIQRPNDHYKLMDEPDKEWLRSMDDHLEILMFLAGYLGGLNWAFIRNSFPSLTTSPTDTTNTRHYTHIQHIDNSTATASGAYINPTSPGPTQIFSASLACSFVVALGAILECQWLARYDLCKHPSLRRWQLHVIPEIVLPRLLQLAQSIFLLGVTNLTLLVKSPVERVALGIVPVISVVRLFAGVACLSMTDNPAAISHRHRVPPVRNSRMSPRASQGITTDFSRLRVSPVDPITILELELRFQDTLRSYVVSESRSRERMSDLLIHAETLFSVLLTSFIDARAHSGSNHPRLRKWWRPYSDCISLAWKNPPNGPTIKELWDYKIVASYISTEDTTFINLYPFVWDRKRLPLHLAGVLCFYVSSCQPWDHILEQMLRLLNLNSETEVEPSKGDREEFAGLYNLVSMVAWALGQSLHPIDRNEGPNHLTAIWKAHTDTKTLYSNFSNCCAVFGQVQTTQREASARVRAQVYKWVIRSMRIIVEDLDKVDDDWAPVASGSLQLVTSAIACRRFEESRVVWPIIQDCLKIITKTSSHLSFEMLDGLWSVIASRKTHLAPLKPVLEFVSEFPARYPGDVTRVFTKHSDVVPRLVDLLGHPSETLRMHTLYVLGRGTVFPVKHNVVDTIFAQSLAAQLKRSPTCPKAMFKAVYFYLGCCVEHAPSTHLIASAFYQEAVSRPIHPSSVAIALVLWDNIQSNGWNTGRHPDWFSYELLNATTRYLVIMSNLRNPWQDSTWAITKAIQRYHNAALSCESLAPARNSVVLNFKEAFARWQRYREASRPEIDEQSDDTLSSNFLEACRLYKNIAEDNDVMMGQVWVRLYKYVIRSVRTLIRDIEDADIWDKAASGGLLVASVVACRGSKEGQLESARAMVQDCLDIVPTRKNPRRQVPFSALTPLWPILSEDIPVDILEAIIGFIMKFTEGRSSDLTDMFYDQPETTDRVIDLLGHREEKLRIHSLNLLTKGVQSALPSRIPHGLTTRDFARLLGRQLKHSMPTHREGMFMAIREFCFAVSLDRSRWALAFCDEALTQSPVCLGTVAIALVLWDGIPRWEHDHTQRIGSTDWFSDGLIKAVTEYLVAMSNSSDSSEPWQDSNEYITKAVESYHDAVVSSKSAAGGDGVGKEPLTEAFTRWKTSRSDRVDAKSPPIQAKHDTEPDRKVSGHDSNGLDFAFGGVDY
ncbi:hypothetical protein FRB99_008159 [Tulasnella sp. 403]|nr:hypothetical protein FRB99_008159 [Tulasnella sp. 403]